MLRPVFEKHKICSNRTKLLLIVNYPILSAKNENLAMEWDFVI